MAFARQNILDTLGKGRYHSCLMTCYSFDFQFFELRVMRLLRAAGIQNVLVLTDGPFLEYLASTASGREFQEQVGFSIYPIYQAKGVFHPKVSLFFGAKEGMLAIGSGNLTASGMGNNDEAWGCFHLADTAAPNAALFADAWGYMQQLTAQVKGVAAVKLTWVKQFAPWLAKLPKPNPGTLHKLDNGLSVAFLVNGAKGILEQALALIEAPVVKRIVTVSPYYDLQGVALRRLHNAYPAAELQCVVEERFGLLPEKLDAQVVEQISFHAWQNCGPEVGDHASRLHAKLVHFTTDQGEYLLLGSANVTAAGMGGGTALPTNEEASILLHHRQGYYLDGLGITPKNSNADSLEKLNKAYKPPGVGEEGVSSRFAKLPIGIVLAEVEQGVLTVYLAREPADDYLVTVRLFSKNGLVDESKLVPLVNPLRIAFDELPDTVNRLELRDEAQRVVGMQFVQHPANQQQYCPDPNRQKLQLGFDALIQSGDAAFVDVLLDMLELEADDTLAHASGSYAELKQDETAKTYEKLSPDEFNQQKQEELLQQQKQLNSTGLHISTFLNELSKRLQTATSDDDYRESAEQGIDIDSDEGNQDTSIDVEVELQKLRTARNNQEKRSIDRFLDRLIKLQGQRLAAVGAAKKPQTIALPPLTLRDYSIFNVALHVAVRYIGRFYYQEIKGKQMKTYFLPEQGEMHDHKTFKSFCTIIGNFLLQCTAEDEQYEEPMPLLLANLATVRKHCFEKCLFLILNAPWKAGELMVRDLLLANVLYYLKPESWSLKDLPSHLAESFEALPELVKFETEKGAALLYHLLPTLVPRLLALQAALALPATERKLRSAQSTQVGDWLYSRKLGICAVEKKYKGLDTLTLTLLHPGFQPQQKDARGSYRYEVLPGTKLLAL